MDTIQLKPGREKSLLNKHPWIFSGAVAQIQGNPAPGATVEIRAANGQFLAWAACSPASNIRARVWSWQREDEVTPALLRARLESALTLRHALIPPAETTALRLVHAESDGLPGLVVDRYNDVLVIQCLTAGADYWRDTLVLSLIHI
jgi:23S rRNA (cytosine1962-C5)-methyltransferase